MPEPRSPRSAATAARRQVLAALKDEHAQARRAFRDFDKLDVRGDADQMHALVTRTLARLELHAALEAEVLYPAAREVASARDLVDEAEVAQASMSVLIALMKTAAPGDEKYVARFHVLGEYLALYSGEEEDTLFPRLARAPLAWEDMAARIAARRAELVAAHRLELDPVAATLSGEAIAPTTAGTRQPAARSGRAALARRSASGGRSPAKPTRARLRRCRPGRP